MYFAAIFPKPGRRLPNLTLISKLCGFLTTETLRAADSFEA
jgi:hypothetical protein